MARLSIPIQELDDLVVTKSVLLADDPLPLLWRGVDDLPPSQHIRLVAMAAERILYVMNSRNATRGLTNILTQDDENRLCEALHKLGEASKLNIDCATSELDESVLKVLDPEEPRWVRGGKHQLMRRLLPMPESLDVLDELDSKTAEFLVNRIRVRLLADASFLLKRARVVFEHEAWWEKI